MKKESLLQLVKYGLVGVVNTLLTSLTIWLILKFVYGAGEGEKLSSGSMAIANTAGYVVGVINSFLLNRNWTFKSKTGWLTGFLKFMLGFAVCFLIQLAVVLILNEVNIIPSFHLYTYFISSAYICQFIGIIVYTASNFLFNKYYTFKVKS